MAESIFIGGGGEGYGAPQTLLLDKANRHGLIAGATGTGKTVTLQIMAEGFSAAGVPVFLSDVKGDLSGLALSGSADFKLHEPFMSRAKTIGLELQYDSYPVTFWDLFGEKGHPIRATVAEMGPLLLSRLMDLTDVQEGVLNVAFRVADEEGLPLLDLKDLQALLVWVGQNAQALSLRYGNVAASSSCSGCCRNCLRNCPRSATLTNPNWCSSLTKRTCCLTTHPKPWSIRSSRSRA